MILRSAAAVGAALLLGSALPAPDSGAGRYQFGAALPAASMIDALGCDGRPMASETVVTAAGPVWLQAMANLKTGLVEELEFTPAAGSRTADVAACVVERDRFAALLGGGAIVAGPVIDQGQLWSAAATQPGGRQLLARWFPGGGTCEIGVKWIKP